MRHVDYITESKINLNPIRPINTSGRTRRQIVEDIERTWLKSHLIPVMVSEVLIHNTDSFCCNECLNKRLDAIIASQEESLTIDEGVTINA